MKTAVNARESAVSSQISPNRNIYNNIRVIGGGVVGACGCLFAFACVFQHHVASARAVFFVDNDVFTACVCVIIARTQT